jgi:protein-disulfide isomerase
MAECAEEQERFWEANDFLFANGRGRIPVGPDEMAAEIELDATLLRTCMKGDATEAAIQRDLEAGRKLNIRGTPTFVIDGRTYPGRVPPEVIRTLLGLDAPAQDGGGPDPGRDSED